MSTFDCDVLIATEPSDAVAATGPVQWALGRLREVVLARGMTCAVGAEPGHIGKSTMEVVIGGRVRGLKSLVVPESFAFGVSDEGAARVLAVAGSDPRGLVYGLLELADQVSLADDPMTALHAVEPGVFQPVNRIRSVMRVFSSAVEDKAWFYDVSFWTDYLTMLATQRFNRFSLTLGLGYNDPRAVRDSYFYFCYPFLVSPEGWNVRVTGVDDAERGANLAMLRRISDLATERGLHFQLGIWNHAFAFRDSPDVNHATTGLTPETHAPYCAAALEALLRACPSIGGITFRSHAESGVPDGSQTFWRGVFEGIARAGRKVEIDIHAKGIDHDLLDIALQTGMPVNVSPKYSAEHMGPPYHQAAIRESEAPPRWPAESLDPERHRGFTRYGYADYLRKDRRYGVLHRVWPGTQRLLLWGDPAMAAGYGRYAHFCDSEGLELFEPASFKGRTGSGLPGDRGGYVDPELQLGSGDWRKHLYTYRLWGLLLYDPDASPESWKRYLHSEFGAAADHCETALAWASRALPLVTVAHHPSAANNLYWPEMYTNMPIIGETLGHPYFDTPQPRVFGMVSPLDPAMFSSINDYADELLAGALSGRYSPLETARRLDGIAANAAAALTRAAHTVANPVSAAFLRLAGDVTIQVGLARFFACKLRAGLAWSLATKIRSASCARVAVGHYRAARAAWAELAAGACSVYVEDVTFGDSKHLRGHWVDRLAAIDEDIAAMESRLSSLPEGSVPQRARDVMAEISNESVAASAQSGRPACVHRPPTDFQPRQALPIELSLEPGQHVASVRLRYRHVHQGKTYRTEAMPCRGGRYHGAVPAGYTDTPYHLMYYFEIHGVDGDVWLWPGLAEDLSNQPYFVVPHQPVGM
jgi:hypothetical protein